MRICIVSWPLRRSQSAILFLSDFLEIMRSSVNEITLITATSSSFQIKNQINGMQVFNLFNIIPYSKGENVIIKILEDVLYQIRVCGVILSIRNKIDVVWIYGGAELVLPMIVARILKKKLYVNLLGLESKRIRIVDASNFNKILSIVIERIEQFSWRLADFIVVESESVIDFVGLNRFRKKIIATGARFIDLTKFRVSKSYEDRENLIGYVGRLSREKGITNFVEAISLIKHNAKMERPLRFVICGDGPLSDEIKKQIKQDTEDTRIEFAGWVSHDDLPSILNRMKLLVLPSSSEGLPTIILEAMACGTPVLATPVGGIPDIIKDRSTGFILKDSSAGNISISIQNILNMPEAEISSIVLNARMLVENEYAYDSSVERYKRILNYEEWSVNDV